MDAYLEDESCGFPLSSQSWEGLLASLVWSAKPSRQRSIPPEVPIYIASGGEDPVSAKCLGIRRLHEAYLSAGQQDVTLQIYEHARHEIFNEINRDEILSDLISWCLTRLKIERTLDRCH